MSNIKKINSGKLLKMHWKILSMFRTPRKNKNMKIKSVDNNRNNMYHLYIDAISDVYIIQFYRLNQKNS